MLGILSAALSVIGKVWDLISRAQKDEECKQANKKIDDAADTFKKANTEKEKADALREITK